MEEKLRVELFSRIQTQSELVEEDHREAVIEMQALLLTFTKVGEETFPRASMAIADMATRMGTDLKTATIQIGKALNDPILGITSLTRSGIQFTESQKDTIKAMAEMGDMAGAQSLILAELETQFGGSAIAARQTFGGAIEALGNAFGDLLEEDGNGLKDATGAIESLTTLMSSSETKAAFGALTSSIITLVELAAKGAVAFVAFGEAIGEFAGDLVTDDLNEQLADLTTEAERLEGTIAKLGRWDGALQSALYGSEEDLNKELEDTQRKIETIKSILKEEAALEPILPTIIEDAAVTPIDIVPDDVAIGSDPLEALLDQAIADEEELAMMSEQADAKLAIQQDYWDRLFNMETGSQTASLRFADAIRTKDLQGALKTGALALSNVSKQSRAMFNVQKALALANAVVTLPSAIVKSFDNAGGYPWGLIPAGLMAAQGASQIAAINSSSFGGGGGSASVSGGGAAPALPPGATATPTGLEEDIPAPRELSVTFPDDSIHSDAMRQFLTWLNEVAEDMGGFDKVTFG